MDSIFIRSSVNATIFIGALLVLYFLRTGLKEGLSLAGGVIFSLLNLYLLWKVIQETITTEEKKKSNIAGLLVLKFIFLWGAFIALMAFEIINPIYFGIGFTVLLLVFALKGFGKWLVEYFNLGKPAGDKQDSQD